MKKQGNKLKGHGREYQNSGKAMEKLDKNESEVKLGQLAVITLHAGLVLLADNTSHPRLMMGVWNWHGAVLGVASLRPCAPPWSPARAVCSGCYRTSRG